MSEKPEEIDLDAKSPAERDRVDLAHEMAGLDTGRIKRFLTDDGHGFDGPSEKKKAERRYQNLLDMLLAEDPHYAALYSRVTEKINGISRAVDQALVEAKQRLEASVVMLQKMRESAAELPNGTKVFRSAKDASIYTEDGKRLSAEEAQDIHIPDGASSWEEYKAQREARDRAQRDIEEIQRYERDVVRPAEERMQDRDDPPSADELERIEEQLETQMPEAVRTRYEAENTAKYAASTPAKVSAAHELVEPTNLSVPDMASQFDLASVGVPDLGPAPAVQPGMTRSLG